MKPAPFTYLAPKSLAEALVQLESYGSEAKVLAGGQSLVPLMNFRLVRPRSIIDVNGLGGLANVTVADGGITIGALVRQRAIEHSTEVARYLPILAEAIRFVGHPAIRNRGTIGGSLVHADPAAELPVVAVALDAEFYLESTRGSRSVTAHEFYMGYLTTVIDPDELLVRVSMPLPSAEIGWCFNEIARRQGDFAIVAVGALLGLDGNRKVSFVRIALGGVGPVPVRALAAEKCLLGERASDALYRKASELAAQELEPQSDIHASAAYRRHIAQVLVRRALVVAESRVREKA